MEPDSSRMKHGQPTHVNLVGQFKVSSLQLPVEIMSMELIEIMLKISLQLEMIGDLLTFLEIQPPKEPNPKHIVHIQVMLSEYSLIKMTHTFIQSEATIRL